MKRTRGRLVTKLLTSRDWELQLSKTHSKSECIQPIIAGIIGEAFNLTETSVIRQCIHKSQLWPSGKMKVLIWDC